MLVKIINDGCGGCGRKKREAANLISFEDISKCNSEELRLLLRENIKKNVSSSLSSISEKLKDHHDYTLLCSDKKLQFIAEADDYCQVEVDDVHCAIFRINLKRTQTTATSASTEGTKVDSTATATAAVKAEIQAVTAANEEKKEEGKPEIKKN
ncbi:ground-like domain protein [Necator americanus]|uniref:Ground-like domain protein n=1 Tax=Necator americanus TaxID=51031 RepID=W2SQE2_NECAM|nr:ground-like domain protein [Necator americanus]ETN71728.1 ground-like domain protein [Necator americanus]